MANARDRNREVTTTRRRADTDDGDDHDLDSQIARLREVLGILSQTYGHRALGAGQPRPAEPEPEVKAAGSA